MKRAIVVAFLVAYAGSVFADDDAPMYTCKVATGKIRAYFKPEIELKDLVTWMMGFSCKTVILGAGVDGGTKVTILAPNPMTAKQAMKLFTDAVDAAGFVVQDKGDNLVIKLGPSSLRPCSSVLAAMPKTVDAAPPVDDAVLAAGIKKLDDTHVQISSAVHDAIVANPAALLDKGARVVPAVKNGKPDGFKLYAIRPNSFYARIGFANGDTLHTLNGFELTSADKVLETLGKVRDAKTIEIGLDRRGKPTSLVITVK
jgi:hypothetical protein